MAFLSLNSLLSKASSAAGGYFTPAWARSCLNFCCWVVYCWYSSIRCFTDFLSAWHYQYESPSWVLILCRNIPTEVCSVFSW
jgi:hypothetical protein